MFGSGFQVSANGLSLGDNGTEHFSNFLRSDTAVADLYEREADAGNSERKN